MQGILPNLSGKRTEKTFALLFDKKALHFVLTNSPEQSKSTVLFLLFFLGEGFYDRIYRTGFVANCANL